MLKKINEHEMCLDFLYNFCLKHILFVKEFNEMFSYT